MSTGPGGIAARSGVNYDLVTPRPTSSGMPAERTGDEIRDGLGPQMDRLAADTEPLNTPAQIPSATLRGSPSYSAPAGVVPPAAREETACSSAAPS